MARPTLDWWAAAPYSYAEVGATRGSLPAGYRHLGAGRVLGQGSALFEAAAERLATWGVQRHSGLVVDTAEPRITAGAVAVVRIGWRGLRIDAPVRVVYVLDEPRRRGFAYGTLPGHPEIGEELFAVSLDEDGTVRGEIRAFSRPGSVLARLGGPVTRWVQDAMTSRYLDALEHA